MTSEAIDPVTLREFGREHLDRAEMYRAHGLDRAAALHFEVAERANDLAHAINQAEAAEPPILKCAPLEGQPIRLTTHNGDDFPRIAFVALRADWTYSAADMARDLASTGGGASGCAGVAGGVQAVAGVDREMR